MKADRCEIDLYTVENKSITYRLTFCIPVSKWKQPLLFLFQTKCFICGIGNDYFDRTPHGFETHTLQEHNLANYLWVQPKQQQKNPYVFLIYSVDIFFTPVMFHLCAGSS